MAFNSGRALGIPDAVTRRYTITKKLGKGSYGTVFNGILNTTNKRYALKRVESVFATTTDARRALREISIMRLCKHPNIIKLVEVLTLPNENSFRNLWVVMEYGGYDLGKFLKLAPTLAGWSEHHVRFISWQVLAALNYLHSANIAHRDLKPTNILVTQDNHVSLIDFGLARQLRPVNTPIPIVDQPGSERTFDPANGPPQPAVLTRQLTAHVVTRWYRPPELLLLQAEYTAAVDVWSFGCIFGEMLMSLDKSRYHGPLFPGRGSFPLTRGDMIPLTNKNVELELAKEDHQLNQIFLLIGTPTEGECNKIAKVELREFLLKKLKRRAPYSFHKKFSYAPGVAVVMLKHMLQFDPSKRVKVSALLRHPYFKDVVYANRMFGAKGMKFPFEDDPRATTVSKEKQRLRELIVREAHMVRADADDDDSKKK